LLREARVASLLTHPNVQAIVDVGHYQQQPFLLMDYVEGTSLANLLVEGTRCPPRLIVPIILDVLRGLQCAHDLQDAGRDLGLVHGDISPDNILVGTDGAARIADFGSARFMGLGEPDDQGTMGKPAYMAPEQLKGEPIDARTDLFAVGVVLWTALTGRKLFVEQSYEQTVMNVLRRPVQPPSAFGAPAAYDEICLKALARTPAGRYTTADEMAAALYRVAVAEELLPAGPAVGACVRQQMSDVLAERRRRLRDLANGDSEPVIVAADGAEADEPVAPKKQAPAATVVLMPAALPRPASPKARTTSSELQAVTSPVRQWFRTLLARLRGGDDE
jgi:serine/threonine-protein kinase